MYGAAIAICTALAGSSDLGLTREYDCTVIECNHYRPTEPRGTAVLIWQWGHTREIGISQFVLSWFWVPPKRWVFPHHGPLVVRDKNGTIWKIYGVMFETWSTHDREREDYRRRPDRPWFPKLHLTGADHL